MLNYNLLKDEGILILTPTGALEESDFAAVARAIDPYIEEKGDLRGLMIEAKSFPGWNDFGAFISHLRFIRDHHRHPLYRAARREPLRQCRSEALRECGTRSRARLAPRAIGGW